LSCHNEPIALINYATDTPDVSVAAGSLSLI